MKNYFLSKINSLKSQNLYRKLVNTDFMGDVVVKRDGKKLVCFSSNDYFSLANNFFVKLAALWALLRFGASARASRYVCGNNSLYEKLESKIAQIKNCEEAIVFSSGYQAAIGIIPALVGEGDLVVADKLIHSSLLDGVKLSGAKLIRFAHNDASHLRKILLNNTKEYQKILIITEEIFSMDGDKADLLALQEISAEFSAMLLVDGAHSLYDAVGAHCMRPSSSMQGCVTGACNAPLRIYMGTFSKAVGSLGGYVAADKITIDYLRNFAKSSIYTTALPPSVLAASLKSLQIISKKNLAAKTLENVRYFCELMNLPKSQSAIVVIIINDNEKVLEIAKKVAEKGFLIAAIRPPTVLSARLRITFCAKHKKSQIFKLAKILQEFNAEK
ncbi:MAG TPA: 8-amino-7-oxononanoate synthase [Rickettsiales bacterium]|nr:8-amino-7-oxononanoate synthase [Rickettsiales bacterium]